MCDDARQPVTTISIGSLPLIRALGIRPVLGGANGEEIQKTVRAIAHLAPAFGASRHALVVSGARASQQVLNFLADSHCESRQRHSKFFASSASPCPLYCECFGYGHSGRLRPGNALPVAITDAGTVPFSTQLTIAPNRSN